MSTNQANKIYPCPFSKSYGIPVRQAWSLLKIFFIYRLIVSSLFVFLFYGYVDFSLIKSQTGHLYYYTSHCYLAFSILAGIGAFKGVPTYTTQAQLAIFSDIIFITLLMHVGGGVYSGIGILLAISIAAGGLLIGGRCALLFAALASVSVIAEQAYATQSGLSNSASFVFAGMLGASFFTIAFLSHVLAKRTEQSEILASQQQQTISNLEELNKYIIQHLQSGIIIITSQQQIKMCNESAYSILNTSEKAIQLQYLSKISPQLSRSFERWMNDADQSFALIKLANENEVHIRFSVLQTQLETFYMIIVEDLSFYNQRIQQSKLASLGCLTASIAHEVRNPLGAISHAGQLLAESPGLSSEDLRLTEIIQSHCIRVNKIIEDVLQLSRRHPSIKEKINLNCWIQDYLQSFIQTSNCDANNFEIKTKETNLTVQMDKGHLKQILDNLCTNALKYGNSTKGKIILELGSSKNTPYIRVLDNSPELDSKIASRLFEPFFTTSATGTGLGLYISKELAELNQANLSYAFGDDNKSSFKFSLPSAENSIIEI